MSRPPETDLERQIERAFNYRGHVTLTLSGGETVEGYVFNRDLGHAKLKEPPFVELFRKGTAERQKIAIARITAVATTGEDHAANAPLPPSLKKR